VCSAEYLAKRFNSRCCGWRCQKRAQRAGYLPREKLGVVHPPPEAPSPAVETELTAADSFTLHWGNKRCCWRVGRSQHVDDGAMTYIELAQAAVCAPRGWLGRLRSTLEGRW